MPLRSAEDVARQVFECGYRAALKDERARQAERMRALERVVTAAKGVLHDYECAVECLEADPDADPDGIEGSRMLLTGLAESLEALDHPTPSEPEAEPNYVQGSWVDAYRWILDRVTPEPTPEIPQHPGPNLTEEDVRRLAREEIAACAKDAQAIDRADAKRDNGDWDYGFWCASSRALGTLAEAASAEPKGGRDEG